MNTFPIGLEKNTAKKTLSLSLHSSTQKCPHCGSIAIETRQDDGEVFMCLNNDCRFTFYGDYSIAGRKRGAKLGDKNPLCPIWDGKNLPEIGLDNFYALVRAKHHESKYLRWRSVENKNVWVETYWDTMGHDDIFEPVFTSKEAEDAYWDLMGQAEGGEGLTNAQKSYLQKKEKRFFEMTLIQEVGECPECGDTIINQHITFPNHPEEMFYEGLGKAPLYFGKHRHTSCCLNPTCRFTSLRDGVRKFVGSLRQDAFIAWLGNEQPLPAFEDNFLEMVRQVDEHYETWWHRYEDAEEDGDVASTYFSLANKDAA